MALSANDAFSAGKRRGRRGRRGRGALSEINVTPLVDVMLVLLIIFMISAPLLTSGVPIELPKTEAGALQDESQPLTLTIRKDGSVFAGEDPIAFAGLAARVRALTDGDMERPVYVRADGAAPYEKVAQVMASLSTSGFSKINLITDTGGPDSGAGADDEDAPG
jgi:biopolymer transport protein TolR